MKQTPKSKYSPFAIAEGGFIYIDSMVVYIYNKCNR